MIRALATRLLSAQLFAQLALRRCASIRAANERAREWNNCASVEKLHLLECERTIIICRVCGPSLRLRAPQKAKGKQRFTRAQFSVQIGQPLLLALYHCALEGAMRERIAPSFKRRAKRRGIQRAARINKEAARSANVGLEYIQKEKKN